MAFAAAEANALSSNRNEERRSSPMKLARIKLDITILHLAAWQTTAHSDCRELEGQGWA